MGFFAVFLQKIAKAALLQIVRIVRFLAACPTKIPSLWGCLMLAVAVELRGGKPPLLLLRPPVCRALRYLAIQGGNAYYLPCFALTRRGSTPDKIKNPAIIAGLQGKFVLSFELYYILCWG